MFNIFKSIIINITLFLTSLIVVVVLIFSILAFMNTDCLDDTQSSEPHSTTIDPFAPMKGLAESGSSKRNPVNEGVIPPTVE